MATPAVGCNGTTYVILKPGKGEVVGKGAKVTVEAEGKLESTGQKFWSTKDPGQRPLTYDAGIGQVIKGWDHGVMGMQLGALSA